MSEKAHPTLDGAGEAFVRGQGDLAAALKVDAEATRALRTRALKLFTEGAWQPCVEVLLGLAALGTIHPADPLMLAACYEKLSLPEAARRCREQAQHIHDALHLTLFSRA